MYTCRWGCSKSVLSALPLLFIIIKCVGTEKLCIFLPIPLLHYVQISWHLQLTEFAFVLGGGGGRKLSYFVDGIKSDLDRQGGKTFFKNPISLNYSYTQKMPGDTPRQRALSSLRGSRLLCGETGSLRPAFRLRGVSPSSATGWPGATLSPFPATTVVV